MSECVKGAYTAVNVGWHGYLTTKNTSIRIGPGLQFKIKTKVLEGHRVGVQSTRNPKMIDNPPMRPAHKDSSGRPWVWVYETHEGVQGWMMWKVLQESKSNIPWARGPKGHDFHVGLEPCKDHRGSGCHGVRRNRVRTISSEDVYLRYSPATPFHILQHGDSVRELYRRTLNDYAAVAVTRSQSAPVGARGWVDVRSLAGEKASGIDVSNFQGNVDFNAVRASGEDFVICKATEGEGFIDAKFFENIQNARAAKLHVGAYHFLRPRVGRKGSNEADDFIRVLKHAKLGKGDIRPVVDVEVSSLNRDATQQYVGEFVGAMRLAGYDTIIYTFPAFMVWTKAFNTDLWIANFDVKKPTLPKPWDHFVIWQYTSSGHVPGVNGRVDRNKCPDLSRIIQG